MEKCIISQTVVFENIHHSRFSCAILLVLPPNSCFNDPAKFSFLADHRSPCVFCPVRLHFSNFKWIPDLSNSGGTGE